MTTNAEKSEALVIRQADFSESSRVVTLFSRDLGKISCVAKGAKRLKGPFEGALDLLTRCHIVFLRKSSASLDLLTEAKLVSRFRPPPDNIRALYGGYYVAELLNGLTEEYDPHPVLFDAAVAVLDQFSQAENDLLAAVTSLELVVLREIGQLPNIEACQRCGKPVPKETPDCEDDRFVFWISQGGLLCGNCYHHDFRQQPVSPSTLNWMQSATESDFAAASSDQLRELRHFAHAAISHALGRRPKMARYLFA